MKLPHPAAQLAGCCWLPRLAAKTRVFLQGEMPLSYRIAFGSRRGIDGYFLRHFRLEMRKVVSAVKHAENDAALVAWFLQQPGVSPQTIAAWNEFAPRLGAKGHPAYATRQIVKWFLYPKSILHPVGSLFEMIVQDEDLGDGHTPGH
ncbi:MAG: DUF5069 domain-containing protein [Opitutae bacterium]|nr:DUF5069 domain-containing protein [Opitutae bacterium]